LEKEEEMMFNELDYNNLIHPKNPNEVFVFGSNLAGRHGAGAAKFALDYGAVYGEGIGLFGRTYAIPTKDHNIKTLPIATIRSFVDEFIEFAKENTDKVFLVTPIGCGLAGYKYSQIAPLFSHAIGIKNVILPKEFLGELNG
jgi:hypothetical protein